MPKLILIRGIPGSGKSTLARALVKAAMVNVHYEADQFFINPQTGMYKWFPEGLRDAHDYCYDNTYQALSEGKSVAVSNTFTTEKEIWEYRHLATLFGIIVQEIICMGEFDSVHDLPKEAMERFRKRAWWLQKRRAE